ncbi:hypothetical protein EVJ50_14145 [Synechococcus sp. RSCCF101]|nr:hypothetical protein EVJ50_14145 [Synechococcus sp. RSCCF101]
MLLGSMALQASALQGRIQEVARWRSRQQEDALRSAAMDWLGRLNRSHGCLIDQASSDWSAGASRPCADAIQLAALQRVEGLDHNGQLLEWTPVPAAAGARLRLQLSGLPGPGSAGVQRQARFWVQLGPAPLRATGLQLEAVGGVGA